MASPLIPDPLFEKQKNEAARLNRRRQSASETSKQIVARREVFFDRLALMNAGALTFSVTLLGSLVAKHPHGKSFLYGAWILLLLAVGACLVRNLSHQHYQMSDAVAKMAEAEIAYIDIDHEIISTQKVMYSDSDKPFDQQREISLNRSNREIWKKNLDDHQRQSTRHWGILRSAEWIAGISMVLGFAFLVVFAIFNL